MLSRLHCTLTIFSLVKYSFYRSSSILPMDSVCVRARSFPLATISIRMISPHGTFSWLCFHRMFFFRMQNILPSNHILAPFPVDITRFTKLILIFYLKSLTTLTWEFSPSCKIKKKINVWNILEENNQVKCNLVEISFSIEKKNTN